MNDLPMTYGSASMSSNGNGMPAPDSGAAGTGFLGGMNMETISALVVLASAFMRR